ncbi:MAG: S8 family serine peptidase [Pseudomonadota bacterium]
MAMIGIDRTCRPRQRRVGWAAGLASMTACLFLWACSGGGGGAASNFKANPSASFLDPVAEPSSPFVASDWSTSQEYMNSTGLAQLKAAEGYARRSGGQPGGQGARIAIIDSGIDLDHPDLGNLHGTSWSAGGEGLVGDDHATFVAGIAAASRTQSGDSNDMHGIAYNATLVNFQASRPSETAANGYVSFGTNDLVDAIRAASGLSTGSSAVESDILNLSLGAASGSDDTFAKLRTAMIAAAGEDKIMIIAAGNNGGSEPIYPAAYADDAGVAGLAIVVGNLTASNLAATSSNLCGATQDYCLFAPGSSIRSTLDGGSYGIGSGTSFAAPYVAGAAAVVKAAFPSVSSEDVVNRLLLTAADLGAAGVDSTFGRGRLDLEAAMAPVGPTGFPIGPSVDGPSLAVSESTFLLGRGLVLSDAVRGFFAQAMAVDSMGFPFPVDLGEAVSRTAEDQGLASFVSSHRGSLAAVGLATAELAAFVPETDRFGYDDLSPSVSLRDPGIDDAALPMSLSADLTGGATVFASLHGGSGGRLGLQSSLAGRQAVLAQTRRLLSPYGGLLDTPSGAGFSFHPAEGTAMALSAYGSFTDGAGGESALQRVEVRQSMVAGIDLSFELGLIQEDSAFLGGETSGAFGTASASSQFLTASLMGPITDDVDWFATYSRGRSSIADGGSGLIDAWSDTRSEAFGAGLLIDALAVDDDRLTLMIGQPLRQERAKASVSLPVARERDGRVVTRTQTIDFSPEAREIAAEIGYQLPLDEEGGHDIRAAAFFRLNPGHDRKADPETGLGLAYRLRF